MIYLTSAPSAEAAMRRESAHAALADLRVALNLDPDVDLSPALRSDHHAHELAAAAAIRHGSSLDDLRAVLDCG